MNKNCKPKFIFQVSLKQIHIHCTLQKARIEEFITIHIYITINKSTYLNQLIQINSFKSTYSNQLIQVNLFESTYSN